MKPRTIQSLLDVREFCLELIEMTESVTFGQYLADRGLQLKTERLLEIIGEAMYRAERSEADLAEEIPEARKVIGIRNRIVHGYDSILDEAVWEAATIGVPERQGRIAELLDRLGKLPSA